MHAAHQKPKLLMMCTIKKQTSRNFPKVYSSKVSREICQGFPLPEHLHYRVYAYYKCKQFQDHLQANKHINPVTVLAVLELCTVISVIGASLSEPHTG